jgi:hypothetical protein
MQVSLAISCGKIDLASITQTAREDFTESGIYDDSVSIFKAICHRAGIKAHTNHGMEGKEKHC